MSPKPKRKLILPSLLGPVGRFCASSSISPSPSVPPSYTPPPTKEQRQQEANWKLQQENDAMRARIAYYNDAVRSIVMRLKVLDIDKLREEMGDDGMIPMRMMLSELAALVKAYDDKLHGSGTYTDSPSPTPTSGGGYY